MSSAKGVKPEPLIHRAWAKINLFLEITGRRPDGYHELDSLVVFAGVGDRVTLEPADDLWLEYEGRFAADLPLAEDNIVLRAAQELARRLGKDPKARLMLTKELPVASGIGGGSADAAAAIEGLLRLWDAELNASDLADLALGLGADVPVCLFGRPALMRGIGEQLERAPSLPAAWLLLVNPGVSLNTAQVFATRSGAFSVARPWAGDSSSPEHLAEKLGERRNDLEVPARALAPAIDTVLGRLGEEDGCLLARMSGSGATCFGLFAGSEQAHAAAQRLSQEQPDWWVQAAPLLHGKLTRHWKD